MLTTNREQNEWKIPLYKIYTDDEDVQLITKIIKRVMFRKRNHILKKYR